MSMDEREDPTTTDEDVEGHASKVRDAVVRGTDEGDDDVEGHASKVRGANDEDDVEGHSIAR